MSPGHAHHVTECSEDDAIVCGKRQTVINSPHRQNANRATGTVNQFDVLGKDVFEAEAVNSVGVAAADFHEAVVPGGSSQATNLFCGLVDQVRVAKLVNKLHSSSSP